MPSDLARLSPRLRTVLVPALLGLTALGQASLAQTAEPVAAEAPAPGPEAPPVPESGDPVTDDQVLELLDSGLIARQAEINEGLLLMDRQLRQAQLAQQLLNLFGAETPIEVAPGEFRTFADTPLGKRELIAQLQLELQLLDLLQKVQSARRVTSVVDTAVVPSAPERAAPVPTLSVREIRGAAGQYGALLRIAGRDLLAYPGDRVGGDIEVVSVQPGEVVVSIPGTGLRVLDAPK